MKQEVKDAVFGARVFYAALKVVVFIVILKYKNQISIALEEGSYSQPLSILALTLVALYYFIVSGHNPGYAPTKKKNDSLQDLNMYGTPPNSEQGSLNNQINSQSESVDDRSSMISNDTFYFGKPAQAESNIVDIEMMTTNTQTLNDGK